MTDETNPTEATTAEASGAARPGGPLPDHPLLAAVGEAVPAASFEVVRGRHVARVEREDLVAFVAACREHEFDMFIDLCAVDYLRRNPRFEVVVNLLAMSAPVRLRILVGVPGTDPSVPSITGVFPGANFYEREAYDLFGLEFTGHPDLTRILLPDDWEGHPLRKDHPVGAVPVQFKGANIVT
jgi:NADH-quinone oxidoreductase subunit C